MITESRSLGTLFLFLSIRFLVFIYKLSPRHRSDGWRKTTEVHHRTEQSKYIGSLLNLAVHPAVAKNKKSFIEKVIADLSEIFSDMPEARFSLEWKKFAVIRVENKFSDFSYVTCSGNGSIEELVFYPGKANPLSELHKPHPREIVPVIRESYNLTKDFPDKKRPQILRKMIYRKLQSNVPSGTIPEMKALVERILGSTWISFREVGEDSMERSQPHWFHQQKNSGFGVFTVHCRHSPDYNWVDIWVQISHVAMDGRAAAKLQGRIRKKLGFFDVNLKFPKDFSIPDNFTRFSVPGRRVFNGCGFVDFTAFIKKNQDLSGKYGNLLPVALLIWNLASQPLFRGIKFNVPVDVPGDANHDRTVGFVFTNPQYFAGKFSGEEAFGKYVENFNDQVTGVRNRSADNFFFLESALMVPHWMLILMVRYMRKALYSLTGSICVTVIEGIEYGIPSLSDNVDSIISISLPIGTGDISGCVSIRSSSDNIKPLFETLKNVVELPGEPVLLLNKTIR